MLPPADPLIGSHGQNENPKPTPIAPSGSKLHISSHASPLAGTDVSDDDVDMFFNFDNDDDVQLSSDCTKKRQLEDGDESSSHSNI